MTMAANSSDDIKDPMSLDLLNETQAILLKEEMEDVITSLQPHIWTAMTSVLLLLDSLIQIVLDSGNKHAQNVILDAVSMAMQKRFTYYNNARDDKSYMNPWR